MPYLDVVRFSECQRSGVPNVTSGKKEEILVGEFLPGNGIRMPRILLYEVILTAR